MLTFSQKSIFLVLIIGVTISGCYNLPSPRIGEEPPSEGLSPSSDAYPRSHFSDLPIPDKFKFDRDKSFIYESGSGTVKIGRLFFYGWSELNSVVAFYQNEMINNGWTLIRNMEDNNTLLLYEKEGWVCTVMVSSTIGQARIEIQIGPK